MKRYVILILLCLCSTVIFSQKNDTIYVLIDLKDDLVMIDQNSRVFLFLDQKGVAVKKSKDSILKGLKRPVNEVDKKGALVIKDQPVVDPWLEFRLQSKHKTINSRELNKYKTKNREEFFASKYHKYSHTYAIVKQKNKNYYTIHRFYINSLE